MDYIYLLITFFAAFFVYLIGHSIGEKIQKRKEKKAEQKDLQAEKIADERKESLYTGNNSDDFNNSIGVLHDIAERRK